MDEIGSNEALRRIQIISAELEREGRDLFEMTAPLSEAEFVLIGKFIQIREHRHSFAHWVVRKFRRYDALLILTMNAPEGKRRDRVEISLGEAKYGIINMKILTREMRKLQEHTEYMGEIMQYLAKRKSDLRASLRRIP